MPWTFTRKKMEFEGGLKQESIMYVNLEGDALKFLETVATMTTIEKNKGIDIGYLYIIQEIQKLETYSLMERRFRIFNAMKPRQEEENDYKIENEELLNDNEEYALLTNFFDWMAILGDDEINESKGKTMNIPDSGISSGDKITLNSMEEGMGIIDEMDPGMVIELLIVLVGDVINFYANEKDRKTFMN